VCNPRLHLPGSICEPVESRGAKSTPGPPGVMGAKRRVVDRVALLDGARRPGSVSRARRCGSASMRKPHLLRSFEIYGRHRTFVGTRVMLIIHFVVQLALNFGQECHPLKDSVAHRRSIHACKMDARYIHDRKETGEVRTSGLQLSASRRRQVLRSALQEHR
jgi:hypothetical protein